MFSSILYWSMYAVPVVRDSVTLKWNRSKLLFLFLLKVKYEFLCILSKKVIGLHIVHTQMQFIKYFSTFAGVSNCKARFRHEDNYLFRLLSSTTTGRFISTAYCKHYSVLVMYNYMQLVTVDWDNCSATKCNYIKWPTAFGHLL